MRTRHVRPRANTNESQLRVGQAARKVSTGCLCVTAAFPLFRGILKHAIPLDNVRSPRLRDTNEVINMPGLQSKPFAKSDLARRCKDQDNIQLSRVRRLNPIVEFSQAQRVGNYRFPIR